MYTSELLLLIIIATLISTKVYGYAYYTVYGFDVYRLRRRFVAKMLTFVLASGNGIALDFLIWSGAYF